MPKKTKKAVKSVTPKPAEIKITGGAVSFRMHSPLPADHPFYQMVGRVASEWSHFEHVLDLIIWDLLMSKVSGLSTQVIACVTSQILGVNPRAKAIVALARARGLDENTIKAVKKLAQASFSVADWRARWVHDPWYMETSTGDVGQFRAMPPVDPRFGIHDIGAAELETTIDKILDLKKRASKLRAEILDQLSKDA